MDTSIWIAHLRKGSPELEALLDDGEVVVHSSVIGELACGNIGNRAEILGDLALLPRANEATPEETLALIAAERLHGTGLGWVDCQLLASARLSDARLLTADRPLNEAVARLRLK